MAPEVCYLVLKEGATKRPDGAEDEVELVDLAWAVGRRVLRGQYALQQVAQHLTQQAEHLQVMVHLLL